MNNKNVANFSFDEKIKKSCHAELVSVSKIFDKTAAMFGLDARIALAIFGALSVITGAALYNAIKDAQVTSLLTEMQEMGKAWEAYYLDTGTQLKKSTTAEIEFMLQSKGLFEDPSIPGWQGPYLNYDFTGLGFNHPKYNEGFIVALKKNVQWGGDVMWTSGKCTDDVDCNIWILVNGLPVDEQLAKALDAKVDGSDGAKDGSLRWWKDSDAVAKLRVFLKYAPIKKPVA